MWKEDDGEDILDGLSLSKLLRLPLPSQLCQHPDVLQIFPKKPQVLAIYQLAVEQNE